MYKFQMTEPENEADGRRRSRSRSRSMVISTERRRCVRTPERNSRRPSRIDGQDRAIRQSRSRTRSRSEVRRMREKCEELEILKQRLAALESQRERASRHNNDPSQGNLNRSRAVPEENERYDPASVFFEEFIKLMKNRPSERESFPTINNAIPEFDPLVKEQTISVWLGKVDECAEIYGWSEKQTIHYALPKLIGHAKTWYQGLPSLKRSWIEWKQLLKDSFPSTENYAELLTEMLKKRARFGDSLELYYYSKINLLNRCKIFGQNAVDCVVYGVDDRGVRVGAQAAKFERPEDVLQFFKTVRDNSDRRDNKKNPVFSRARNDDQSNNLRLNQQPHQIVCFNCKQKGHPSFKCPKPLVKCSYCNLVGHNETECRKKNDPKTDPKVKTVLKVLVETSDHCFEEPVYSKPDNNAPASTNSKYMLPIKINNRSILSLLDLGSETTLVRKSDAEKLGLHWVTVEGPYLRGLGNIPYLPRGYAQVTVEAQGVVEKNVEVYVVDDHLMNCSVLLGHSFTERPLLRIVKTATELTIERVNRDGAEKVMLTTMYDVTIPVGKIGTISVKSNSKQNGDIYVPGSVRGTAGNEYYLFPGEYQLRQGECNLLVHNLGSMPVSLQKGSLVTRARNVDRGLRVNLVTESQLSPAEMSINCGNQLTIKERHELEVLLTKYKTCFSWGMRDLGYTTETEMTIHLKDSEPVVYRPYRLSLSERRRVQDMIDEMMEYGIVRESCSPYASPIVLVQKKSGEKRLCVDYRALNSKTKRDHYPLPRIEDLLDQLSGQSIFTTLDLASGYHQIALTEESIEKTAFVTPDGQYEYTRMPFGLANAPAVFQRLIHKVLNKAKIKHSIVYMDDILIPARTFCEGLFRLEEVLTALQESGLTLKMEKCNFFKETIDFLGFEISQGEIKPGVQKIQAVAQFVTPANQHDVRRFLGLTSFFRRFVRDFATIARPLTDLLRKNTPWKWGDDEAQAYENLKQTLIQRPVLALYDHTAETQLHTDASQIGLAGILLQRKDSNPFRAVAYFSRRTTADEQKLHSFELETLAVVGSLNKFRVYLLGIKFTIFTDCHALRSTFTKRDLIPRISRWWIQFLEYDCTIEYRPGEKMTHVDCLSRNPIPGEADPIHTLDVLAVHVEDWITTVQTGDSEVKRVKEILEDPETAKIASIRKEYKLKNGRVYRIIDDKTDRWVVPRGVRWQLLKANHDDIGHFGFDKTLERIRAFFWFPKMRKFVKKYVSSCLGCAHHKIPSGAKEGSLHPIPKIEIPFHTIHADHLGPFVRSKKKNMYLLVIVDSFTKYVNLTAVRSTKSKASIKVFQNYFSLFGVPTRLITDRGTSFTSKKFKTFTRSVGIKHILNSVATPRANGQVERYNRTILSALGAMTHGKDSNIWDDYVSEVQLGINSTVHEVTKRTPTELLFGRKVVCTSQGVLNEVLEEVGNGMLHEPLQEIRDGASERIKKNQEANKRRFDQRRKPPTSYNEGDLVRVVRAIQSGTGQSKKLESKCQGPYKIKKVLPHDRYIVEDTPLTRKGRRYEGTVSIDKIFPWLSYGADFSSSESSDED